MAEDIKKMPVGAGLPEMPEEIVIAPKKVAVDYKRIIFILLGLALFFLFYFMPEFADAVDPSGKHFPLPPQGRMALGLFLMAAVWWIFEVMPIGATAIAIGLFQVIFTIRTADQALKDFFDPSVWFIFGSVVMGLAFAVSGLTKRMAYKMLNIVGENTNFILLGTFLIIAGMTLLMAHTAVAAAIFPLLVAIHSLYSESDQPTRFGKGLFIGMAWTAGAGSVITFLGSARAVAGAGMFQKFTGGTEIGFFSAHLVHAPPGGAHGVLHLAHRDHFLQTRETAHRRLAGTGGQPGERTGPHEQQGKVRHRHGGRGLGTVHDEILLPHPLLQGHGPGGHHDRRQRALLPHRHPDGGGHGDHPLEHHPAVRRGHVHRLLPL